MIYAMSVINATVSNINYKIKIFKDWNLIENF